MDQVTSTNGKPTLPPHEFVLMELVGLERKPGSKLWDYDNCEKVIIGYAQRNTASKYLSYNIVKVGDTGDVIATDIVADSRQDGNYSIKVRGEETVVAKDGTSRTFPFTSLATLYNTPQKADPSKIYFRGNAYTGKAWEGKVLRMFPNDGKFGANPALGAGGAVQATGT